MQKQLNRTVSSHRFAFSDLRRSEAARVNPDITDGGVASALTRIESWRKSISPAAIRHDTLEFHGRVTLVSFRLERMRIGEAEVVECLLKGGVRGDLRSRQAQMVRNHVAILRHIELCLARASSVEPSVVLGWYASLCGGLAATGLDALGMRRLDLVCRQINSPPMRLHAAIADVSSLYSRLLQDPLVHSFNGIFARLLLRYHLGRCGLPQVVFDDETDFDLRRDERRLYRRLVVLLEERLRQISATAHF